jgi:outer membrane immunogenic protein
MRRFALAFLACSALGFSQSASAADMPVAVKARPVPQAVPYNWTGFYVGGHFGGGISRNAVESSGFAYDFTSPTVVGPPAALPPAPFFSDNFNALLGGFNSLGPELGTGSVGSHNATGPLGGVQAGYNWQAGHFLFGIEGQYSFARLRGDHQNSANAIVPFNVSNEVCEIVEFCFGSRSIGTVNGSLNERFSSTVKGIGTIAGRLGLISDFSDRTLFYVKGGAAYARTKYSVTSQSNASGHAEDITFPCIECTPNSVTDATLIGSGAWSGNSNRWGWMGGIGLEYGLFGGWTAKIEYDYLGFGTRNVTLTGSSSGSLSCTGDCGQFDSPASVTGPSSRTIRVNQDIQLVKLGLNYRFGAPGY